MKILVTGATGYIGGRLIKNLISGGHTVRVLVRDRSRIEGRSWCSRVEVVVGDVLKSDTLEGLCDGCDAAYYLIHSMYDGSEFEEMDRRAASNFARAVRGVKHVIYLGGLLPESRHVSKHLRSRAEVGKILRDSLPVTEFRAGPIIGSGSASFEMVRYLTERLPVMMAPRWIHNEVQPVSVSDVLEYLVKALEIDPAGVVNIGCKPLTYREMMMRYAAIRGLKRRIITVPVLAPKLAALWVGLVTPISNSLAVPLIEGIIHPVTGDTAKASALFPHIETISYENAVRTALDRVLEGDIETRWSGALGTDAETYSVSEQRGLIRERRSVYVNTSPKNVYRSFTSLGGDKGWLVWSWVWRVRGTIDRLIGGPGLRRGRRHPEELLRGEALDFWRVEEVRQSRLLRLRAEMKVPGKAWLEWRAIPEGEGTRLLQSAMFAPTGLWGILYWRALYPFHKLIFNDMIKAIAEDSLRYGESGDVSGAPYPVYGQSTPPANDCGSSERNI